MKRKTAKPKSKDVTLTVTQNDYNREIRAGISPNEALKPGVYQGRRGGFLERHRADLASGKVETKVGIYIKLDRDIIQFFKDRAAKSNAAPYQTQINNALRTFIEGTRQKADFSQLLDNEMFIAAVAERIQRQAG